MSASNPKTLRDSVNSSQSAKTKLNTFVYEWPAMTAIVSIDSITIMLGDSSLGTSNRFIVPVPVRYRYYTTWWNAASCGTASSVCSDDTAAWNAASPGIVF
ncbi:hypothetical protein Ddc_14064 [Ditylenchus destructor]|nr:hypothetical protein Ddc_14064 [Ditylenchus destructor]